MVKLTVNGREHDVSADPDTPLLYVLRDELALNGAKFGCGLGQCGACTVMVDGKAVFSCVTPILLLEGKQVTTVEGLGTLDNPGPMQRAFIEEQAAQCGYCIPGMMMRAQALLAESTRSRRTPTFAPRYEPNLCRCGTHMRILRAVKRAARLMQTAAASSTGMGGTAMKQRLSLLSRRSRPCRHRRAGCQLLLAVAACGAGGSAGGQQSGAAALPGSLKTRPLLDAWIRIDANGSISVFTGKAELGQGIKTALLQVAAEELECRADAHHVHHRGHGAHAQRGLHLRQPVDAGQRHGDPTRGGAGARAADCAAASALALPEDAQDRERRRARAGRPPAGYGELVAPEMLHVRAQPAIGSLRIPRAFR